MKDLKQKPKRIYLTSLQQPEIMGDLKALPFDPLKNSQVQKLKVFTQIQKVTKPDQLDLEQALAIAQFVSESWKHDGFNSHPKKQDALTLLKLAENGASFSCVQFASVFVQLCHSVGIPARVLQARTKNPDLGSSGHGHVTAEYFDNQLGQWVWVDPQIHAYATYRGKALSLNEYAELVVVRKFPKVHFSARTFEYVQGKVSRLKDLITFTRQYTWSIRVGGFKSFYTKQADKRIVGCKRQGVRPVITFQGFAEESPEYLSRDYFDAPINSCQIRIKTFPPPKAIKWKSLKDYKKRAYLNFAISEFELNLKHNMPWFDHYLVTFNGQSRKLKANQLKLKFRGGLNTLSVQAVNSTQRTGPASTATIQFDNKYKNVTNYW